MFTRIRAISDKRVASVGPREVMLSIVFYTHAGNIRCNIHLCMFSLRVGLRVGGAYAFTAIVQSPRFLLAIVFYTPWANMRLTSCFYGVARMHVRYHDSHASGPHQSIELLLRDRPDSCSLFAFTRIFAVAG